MYKIYINGTPIFLTDIAGLEKTPNPDEKNMRVRFLGNPKLLLGYVDMLEKSQRFTSVTLFSENLQALKDNFFKHFKLIKAAGGLVLNPKKELLMIYRRGSWDLPKGKIDSGETKEVAAVREVQEETSLKNIQLGTLIYESYHTYRSKKNNRILKKTYWFEMYTSDYQLIPQKEEDIEEACWKNFSAFLKTDPVIYGNIKDLLYIFASHKNKRR